MQDHHGPIITLTDAMRAQVYIWAFCLLCGHARKHHPAELIGRVQHEARLVELEPRMLCMTCSRKHVALIPSVEHFASSYEPADRHARWVRKRYG